MSILLHWQKEELPPLTMPLLRFKVPNTMKLMTTMMERKVWVYVSSPVVYLKASEARGELDWKSEQIASEIYSQWRTHWINKQEAEKSKGKTLSKRLFEENSKDDSSHKKTKVLVSTSKSVSLDPLPVDLSDSVCLRHVL